MAVAYEITWDDTEKTILRCHLNSQWTWTEAFLIINEMNDLCSTVDHGVYSVFDFASHTSIMPHGGSALANIRKLMAIENPNDELTLFVGLNPFGRSLIGIASRVYGLEALLGRIRFIPSLDEARLEIDKHKQKKRIPE